MTTFTIEVKDDEVQALLQKLASRAGGLAPVLAAIGEGITDRTKRRFETSSGPDGVKWRDNSAATLGMLAGRLGGKKSKVKKDGSLNASGRRSLANKKPLIDSGFLRQQIVPSVSGHTLTVRATPAYAAIQQFGGTTGAGSWIPGKAIPARPFLPVRPDNTLYPEERDAILSELNAFLQGEL